VASAIEVFQEIISDGKIVLSEAKRYMAAATNKARAIKRVNVWREGGGGGGGTVTPDALDYIRSQRKQAIDIVSRLPRSLKRLAGISAAAAGVLATFAEKPTQYIQDVIFDTITNYFLLPVGRAVFFAGEQFLGAVSFIIYGSNYRIGLGGSPGFLDLPLLVSEPIADLNLTLFGAIADFLVDVNTSAAQPLTQLGIGAPAAAAVFWFAEISIIAYLGWVAIRTVDIPGINPADAFLAATRPVRNVMEWFR
jgi:hypothetical protein